MTERTPEEIAAGLSEAQQRIVCAMSAQPKLWRSIYRHAKQKRRREWCGLPRGLYNSTRSREGFLEPLGLAVKSLIEKDSRRGG